jgi:glycosyltransferase involved in cell wall biosynthesis
VNTRGPGTRQVLVYVNQVYADDYTGQGTFERELITALRDRVRSEDAALLQVFTVRRPGAVELGQTPDTTTLLLDKSRALGYVVHQLRLLMALAWTLLQHRHEDVTVFVRYAPSSLAPVAIATALRRRLVLRTGPVLSNRRLSTTSRWLYALVHLGFWWNCRAAARIVVVTEQVRRSISASFRFAFDKAVVIPNGANVERFSTCGRHRTAWGLEEHGLVLGFVGYLYEDQGLDTVIRALARIEHATGRAPQLLVVGDGPCADAWKTLACELGVASRVVFSGEQPYAAIGSAIAACDVMLAPFTRHAIETTGSSALKLFEYLACDKPVLAVRAQDHEFLSAGGVGWLVEPEDVDAWARAIQARMHAPICDLGGRGRRLVQEQHNYQLVADRIWSACFNWESADRGPGGRRLLPTHG